MPEATDPRSIPDPLPWARIALASLAALVALATVVLLLLVARPLISGWLLGVAGAAIAFSLCCWYMVVTARSHVLTKRSGARRLRHSVAEIKLLANELESRVHFSHAWLFYELLANPNAVVDRISERVAPNTRSLSIATTVNLSIPSGVAAGQIVVPVLVPEKRRLLHGLRFFDSNDTRVASLTELTTLAYAATVFRMLIYGYLGSKSGYEGSVEDSVLRAISGGADKRKRGKALSKLRKLEAATIRESGLAKNAMLLIWARELLIKLSTVSPVCVVHEHSDELAAMATDATAARAHVPFPSTARFRVEHRIVAAPIRGKKIADTAQVKARRSIFVQTSVELLRSVVGVRSTRFYFPLENADRSASYHLEFSGPDGTYLASQGAHDYPSGSDATERKRRLPIAFQPRYGQRHAHLYIRNGSGFESRYARFVFFERPPGSMAPATLTALAATIVIGMVLLSDGDLLSVPSEPDVDLVALAFTFPPLLATWFVLGGPHGLEGGVLVARASLALSAVLSVIAGLLYLLGPVATDDWGWTWLDTRFQWGIVAGLAIINLIASASSWAMRMVTHYLFVRRAKEI